MQILLKHQLGTVLDTDSPGISCKSDADLYDGLTLCVADFVDMSLE